MGSSTPLPEGAKVADGVFKTYRTTPPQGYDVGPQNRVLLSRALQADEAILRQFDSGAAGPSGYKNLMADLTQGYQRQDLILEVIAELDTNGTKATRLLRLTADQGLLQNENRGRLIAETGEFYFRGQAFSWVTIDNGPLLSGTHDQGLFNMSVNFGTQTANIELRNNSFAPSEVELSLKADNLPFNIRTGAFGGPVTLQVGTSDLGRSQDITADLRGNVGGSPVWSNGGHNMTTSGLFSGSGKVTFADGGPEAKDVVVDGIWFGRDVPRGQ